MKVNEIEVRVGITKNMGNFESLRYDIGMRIQVDETESALEAVDKSREWVVAKIKADVEVHGKDMMP